MSSIAKLTKTIAWQGWVIAFFTTLLFSIAPPITKAIINLGVDPATLLMLRYGLALLFMFGTIIPTAPHRLRISFRILALCIVVGLMYALSIFSFTWSLTRINASVGSMVFSLYPLIVLILLTLRGAKISRRAMLRMTVGLAGIYLLIGWSGRVDLVGAFVAFVSSLLFSAGLVFMQWFLKNENAQTITLYLVAIMALFATGLWFIQRTPWQSPSWQGWLLIAVLAIGSTYLGQLGLLTAVRTIGSGQMSLFFPLEVLLTIIWSLIFLRESLTGLQWAGSAFILGSLLLAIQRKR